MTNNEAVHLPQGSFSFGFGFPQPFLFQPKGVFSLKLESETGETLVEWEKENTLTHLAPLFAAWLFSGKGSPSTGVNALILGTGGGDVTLSTGERKKKTSLITPTAVAKVGEVSFVDGGDKPTNQVDYKFVFGPGKGDGSALNEMGLAYLPNVASTTTSNDLTIGSGKSVVISGTPPITLSPPSASYDPQENTTPPDIRGNIYTLINYLPFGVITKPGGSTLTITWRLTF